MKNILTKDKNFKMLFGSYEHIRILTEFLSDYLDIPYEAIEGKVKLIKKEMDEKVGVIRQSVDVLVELPDRKIQIEMNPVSHKWLHRRNFIYLAREYISEFNSVKSYYMVHSYIQINFNDYKEEGDEYKHYYIQSNKGEKYLEDIEIHEINIPECRKRWYNGSRDKIGRWASIFASRNIEELETMIGDDLMSKETKKEFIDTVKIIRKGEPGWWDYEKDAKMIENSIRDEARDIGHQEGYKEGKRKGEIEGRKVGIKEGIKEEKIIIAKKMKKSGQSIDYINEMTGLTIEEITKL